MDRLGIDFLTFLGMPPLEYVALADRLGVKNIGVSAHPLVASRYGYPNWSLLKDGALRRDFAAAVKDRGMTVRTCDIIMMPGMSVKALRPIFDMLEELDVMMPVLATLEQDRSKAFDDIAAFAEMAGGRTALLEFAPVMGIPNIATAEAALTHAGDRANLKILFDMLHIARSGAGVAELAAVSCGSVGYIQLCDAPLSWTIESYADEASNNRLCPGEGELPLFDWLCALPDNVPIGIETPMADREKQGVSMASSISSCLLASLALIDRVSKALAS